MLSSFLRVQPILFWEMSLLYIFLQSVQIASNSHLNDFCPINTRNVKTGMGHWDRNKIKAGRVRCFRDCFFFWSCMTFVIDNLLLKLCEPQFKLRTLWKIRIGDVFREERF